MTIIVILAIGAMTFLLRFTPLLLVRKNGSAKQKHGFLENLPLAILSAMIIPGIFQVDKESPWVGIAAGAAAIFLLVFVKKIPLFGVITASVAVAVVVALGGGH
ncbi:AzlD domain-containing protein [Paenibacillus tepidiphilus]|uniref:AzlD domain-containing protein n=1 Tax=Paenibacillus tepidiphilus TaxID=2608683 RepID=UPI00123AB093|nr:AzlD domain-containing protein [Paenibacillus tepidiphilus]